MPRCPKAKGLEPHPLGQLMESFQVLLPTLRITGAKLKLSQDRGAKNDVLGPELLEPIRDVLITIEACNYCVGVEHKAQNSGGS